MSAGKSSDWVRHSAPLLRLRLCANVRASSKERYPSSRRSRDLGWTSAYEHPAGIWKRKFEKVLNFSSGIDPVGTLLGEHLEDNAAEVSGEGADGLVVSLSGVSAFETDRSY